MSELLRSVMAECAEMARAGRRASPFAGCAHGQFSAALAVAEPAPAPHRARAIPRHRLPLLVHDQLRTVVGDAVLPIVLPQPERWATAALPRPQPARRAA